MTTAATSERVTFECQTCGARLDIARHQRSAQCAFCASPTVVERPPTRDRPNPRFIIGFSQTREQARGRAQKWLRYAVFAPEGFRRATPEAIGGVYMPAYLYTAAAYSWYRAEIGEAYTETETVTKRDEDGNKVTETREVTKHEWHKLSGDHAVYISDHVVTASRGLPDRELQGVTPFDLRALRRFSPLLISGWAAEEPSRSQHESLELARAEARKRIRGELGDFMPGDLHRLSRHHTDFHDEHMELTLLPLWVLPVRYAEDKPVVRLLVNGQTGQVWGRAPISIFKVVTAIALVLTAIVLAQIFLPQVL